jgi:radical SAM superfamily enzyme YgiQ (UPF0313 family)
MKKKKILLVLPRNYEINFINISEAISRIIGRSGGPMVLSLATIAALTPPEFEVQVIDEDLEPVDFDRHYDIVGIGGFSCYLNRAERIAREFSRRGSLIVCGGSPVTLSPERWRPFTDVLIIGEAERTWPMFLKDYLEGDYETEYREDERPDLSLSPIPDYSAFPKGSLKRYLFGILQTGRGCPYKCEFCSVHGYVGNQMRYKPIPNIISELEQLYRLGAARVVLLADDNFPGNRRKAKEILRAIGEWNRGKEHPAQFIAQVSMELAGDEEFLELSANAGLTRMSIGVETPNKNSLQETGKFQNLIGDMHENLRTFNEFGILVQAGSIVGFDNDDAGIFRDQYEFFNSTGIPNIQVMPLQAPDGSPLKQRMIREGRYIDWETALRNDPEHMNSLNCFTVRPKQFNLEQMRKGLCWLLKELYEPDHFIQRMEVFFGHYERSPKRKTLQIPSSSIDWYSLGLTFRLMDYVFRKASLSERRTFRQMYRIVSRSSHPHRMMFLVNSFLSLLNTRTIIRKSFPEIDTVNSPEVSDVELAGRT